MKGDTGLLSAENFIKPPCYTKIMAQRFYLLKDAWDFMKERKNYWLLPIIIILLLFGVLIIIGQSSSLSPFIYALF